MPDTDRLVRQTDFNVATERKKLHKRFVNPNDKWDDRESLVLGAMGCYNTRFISKKTGLSENQVIYRLGLYGIRRTEMRNGEGPFAKFMLSEMHDSMTDRVFKYIQQRMKK